MPMRSSTIKQQAEQALSRAMAPVPKALALALLGGTYAEAARRIGCSRQAVEQWPDPLPERIGDRVLAACVRFRIEERIRKGEELEGWEHELVMHDA